LSIFIQPPSIAVLAERLRKRKTDAEDKIQMRLAKAEEEIEKAPVFDLVVVNDDLNLAIEQVATQIKQFLD
jgi:guanylate kinase